MTKRNRGWTKIKTLTPEQTADARARMGLDKEGLRRSRTGADLIREIKAGRNGASEMDRLVDEAEDELEAEGYWG